MNSPITLGEQAIMLLLYDNELTRNEAKIARLEREAAAIKAEVDILQGRQHALQRMILLTKQSGGHYVSYT